MAVEDIEIIALLKNDQTFNKGFDLLYRKYSRKLYQSVRRIVITHEDTDEILQRLWIKVWKHIHSFRGDAQLYTWLYRIAYNESISFVNSKKKFFFFQVEDTSKSLVAKLEAAPDFDGDEIQKKLLTAVLQLPKKQQQVFQMKYFEDLKYEEISAITGTSVGALKANYHAAVKKVEKYFEGD